MIAESPAPAPAPTPAGSSPAAHDAAPDRAAPASASAGADTRAAMKVLLAVLALTAVLGGLAWRRSLSPLEADFLVAVEAAPGWPWRVQRAWAVLAGGMERPARALAVVSWLLALGFTAVAAWRGRAPAAPIGAEPRSRGPLLALLGCAAIPAFWTHGTRIGASAPAAAACAAALAVAVVGLRLRAAVAGRLALVAVALGAWVLPLPDGPGWPGAAPAALAVVRDASADDLHASDADRPAAGVAADAAKVRVAPLVLGADLLAKHGRLAFGAGALLTLVLLGGALLVAGTRPRTDALLFAAACGAVAWAAAGPGARAPSAAWWLASALAPPFALLLARPPTAARAGWAAIVLTLAAAASCASALPEETPADPRRTLDWLAGHVSADAWILLLGEERGLVRFHEERGHRTGHPTRLVDSPAEAARVRDRATFLEIPFVVLIGATPADAALFARRYEPFELGDDQPASVTLLRPRR